MEITIDFSITPDYSKQINEQKRHNFKILKYLYEYDRLGITSIYHNIMYYNYNVTDLHYEDGLYNIEITHEGRGSVKELKVKAPNINENN